MSYEEYEGWLKYFEQRPIGWREDLRTSYIMSAFGAKNTNKMFPSLVKLFENAPDKRPTESLRNSALFNKILSAKKGEKLEILKEV